MATKRLLLFTLFVELLLCETDNPEHSFLIHLYDNYLEVNVELETDHGAKSLYSLIVTDHDAIYKYKFESKEAILDRIRDAINDEVDKSIASYQLTVRWNDKMEFVMSYDDGVAIQSTKFMLYLLKKPSISQETKLIIHLERQIYQIKRKNKALKSMTVPRLGIIMWQKCNDVPSGYVLCDGDNDTPDLRKMFVVNSDEWIDDVCNEDDASKCSLDPQQKEVSSNYYDLCYIMKT